MTVSVVIPTYDRNQSLARTLRSLVDQTLPGDDFEIIVVDNGPLDDTKLVVAGFQREHPERRIRYLAEARQGVHFARNSGAKIAEGKFLYFTDDDMVADPSALVELLRVFDRDDSVGTATGSVLPRWEVPPPGWVSDLCNNYLLSLNDPDEEVIVSETDCNVFSCHQMVRRDVFFSSGGFNPENTRGEWIGDGETGLNEKIRALGFKFASNRASVTYHLIPSSRMTQRYLNRRLYNEGNCVTYAWYRRRRPTPPAQALWGLDCLAKFAVNLGRSVVRLSLADSRWRLAYATCHYHLARFRYNLRLLTQPSWRALVLKTDWLAE